MKVVLIGNGILALATAFRLLRRDPDVRLSLIGPADRLGCASLAAAAMFNSFCEVDPHTLGNPIERQKFLFNKSATPLWPGFLAELETPVNHGFGTFLINNLVTDSLEDDNFAAVVAGLKEFGEPYEVIDPAKIANYKPSPQCRAARGIFIPGEGWINPLQLVAALHAYLERSGRVEIVDGYCQSLQKGVSGAVLQDGRVISGDVYLLAPGAAFTDIVQASELGLDFPRIFYGVGCSILLETGPDTVKNCVRTPNRGLACGIYTAPQDPEHTLVGASNFISPVPENHPRLTSVHNLIQSAMEQINTDYYRAQLVRVNTGWRPTSEDTLPLLGQTSIQNLLVATGTKRDGLHCAPVISNYLADLILQGSSSLDLSLYKPERRPMRIYTREDAIRVAVRHTMNAAYQHGFKSAKNRMVEDLEAYYRRDLEELHDRVGAHDWGIPPEMINMYRYGHAQP